MISTSTVASAALVIAIPAAILALIALWAATRKRAENVSQKRLRELESGLLDCLDALDKLTVVAKRKYSRDAVRASRAAAKQADGTPDPQTDPEGWKKEMMRRRVLGVN